MQLKKALEFVNYVLRARKAWRRPQPSKVMVFDESGSQVLINHCAVWNPVTLHVRGELIYMPLLIASFFRPGKRWEAYIDCFIEAVSPRLVVTFIDNSVPFFSIRARHPQLKTLFIQNGWRSHYADIFEQLELLGDDRRGVLAVDYMLTFGEVIGRAYRRHIKGQVIPIGSVKNNMIPVSASVQSGLIAFVSQWHPNGFDMAGRFFSHEEFFENVDRLILKSLVSYARTNGKRLAIIPRNPQGSPERENEEAYFSRLCGHACEFLHFDGPYASYPALDVAEIVVTVDSTLGYEAIARGKKTAILALRSSMLNLEGFSFGWPGDFAPTGPFWTNRNDPMEFQRILDHLFSINATQWNEELQETRFPSLMRYDPGNTALALLLERELGSARAASVPGFREEELIASFPPK